MTTKAMAPAYDPAMMILDILLMIWVLGALAIGLWKSARNGQKVWFTLIFILGLLSYGLFPVIYLFGFAKPRMKISELAFWKKPSKK